MMSIRNSLLILVTNLLFFNLAAQSIQTENVQKDNSHINKKYHGDIRIDPIMLALKDVDIALEFFAGENLSLEFMLTYITRNLSPFDLFSNPIVFETAGLGVEFFIKHYFSSDHNFDGLFISPYARYRNIEGATDNNFASVRNKRFTLGLGGGYKHMLNERVSLELMVGLGFAVSNDFKYSTTFNREPDFGFTNVDLIIRLPLAYRF